MSDAVLRRQSSNATNKAGDAMDMSAVRKDDKKEEEKLPKPPRCGGRRHRGSSDVVGEGEVRHGNRVKYSLPRLHFAAG